MGIAVQIRDAMITADGVSRDAANLRFWMVDREGLLYHVVSAEIDLPHQKEFYRPASEKWDEIIRVGADDASTWEGATPKKIRRRVELLDTVKEVKPTVLIGCSTASGAFTEEVVKAMAEALQQEDPGTKPIIMPLSNPGKLVEAKPEDVLRWTGGRALVATGSPFGNVNMDT
ncbi:uncharacterized protein LACBIDRAFT_309784 [Laccaria bicolor S238N-H82]|uniref:Predicted protein n=1 Tax=Laccaria bicolor (strain S238N-H82 / ATCC MYA-4686) TaxID=486041 RepID=B0E4S7_LACBS|nr:uncharacterized protein LACBIDRAFT_309784 [Laccaria bicolor S238N-H82]EDQ98154.1 predicted protein [Laccaria bicolor S238N-H82]|eukprot:XP_001891196.1 predicted protein [Laccaria bicolor S238N-H82]